MKKINRILCIPVLLITTIAMAADLTNPGKWLSAQGILLQPTGQRVADGSHRICFRLFEMQTGGTEMWSECDLVHVNDGFYQSRLGDSVVLPFANEKAAYLQVELDGETMEGRIPLTGAVRAWNASAVSDTVLPTAGLGPGLAVRSLNGLRNDLVLATRGNITLDLRSDTLLLEGHELFDSTKSAWLDSAQLHRYEPHRMFTSDSSKAKAERTANTTRDGILSAADYGRFSQKGNMHADSLHTIRLIPHSTNDGWAVPTCNSANQGLIYYRSAYYSQEGTGALVLCHFNGAIRSYQWVGLN